jgi:hypothetical protein
MAIGTLPGYVAAVRNYQAAQKPITFPKPKPYNPLAYVPGGSAPQVARAIQSQGSAVPKVAIPSASSIVKPIVGTGSGLASTSTDPYSGELTADPMYGLGQKNYQDALDMGERTLLRDPINQLIAQYGYDPRSASGVPQNLADIANKYLDPAALDAAKANPYTTANQIGKSFTDALNAMPYDLAARGAQASGAANIIGSNLGYQRGLADKQAIDQLLQGIGTANQNWTDFQTNQANTWRQAQEDIATRLAQQAGYHEDLNAPAPVPALQDYSGGASAVYQPSPATAKLIQKVRSSGQSSAWETAMKKLGSTAVTGGNKVVSKKVV